jgi:hypothetical protein
VSGDELAALIADIRGAGSATDTAVATLAPLNPEPLCRLCMKALDIRDVDVGTHVECDPVRDVGTLPAPVLAELSAALVAYEQSRDRSRQATVGPSEVGVACDRRLGYILRNAPKQPDEQVKWAPMLGTAMHAVNADALTLANERLGRIRWLVERRVEPMPGLFGNTDAYDTDTDTVTDWKIVGKSTVEKARRHGPSEQYVVQAHVYGRGWQRLGYDPKWVRILYLPRWSHSIDDAYEWTAPYSRLVAEKALARLRAVDERLTTLDVAAHPERWADVAATPTSDACHWCPYHRRARQAVDFHGCSGYQSKPAQAVNDYLSSLPDASATGS